MLVDLRLEALRAQLHGLDLRKVEHGDLSLALERLDDRLAGQVAALLVVRRHMRDDLGFRVETTDVVREDRNALRVRLLDRDADAE